jgi:hypothetical protein
MIVEYNKRKLIKKLDTELKPLIKVGISVLDITNELSKEPNLKKKK